MVQFQVVKETAVILVDQEGPTEKLLEGPRRIVRVGSTDDPSTLSFASLNLAEERHKYFDCGHEETLVTFHLRTRTSPAENWQFARYM
jgi:hypothetical protein